MGWIFILFNFCTVYVKYQLQIKQERSEYDLMTDTVQFMQQSHISIFHKNKYIWWQKNKRTKNK